MDELFFEQVEGYPYYAELSRYGFHHGNPKELLYGPIIIYYHDGFIDWVTHHEDILRVADALRTMPYGKVEAMAHAFIAELERLKTEAVEAHASLAQLGGMSFGTLVAELDRVYRRFTAVPFPGFLDAIKFMSDIWLERLVGPYASVHRVSVHRVLADITHPERESFLSERQRDVGKQGHEERFFWSASDYTGYTPYMPQASPAKPFTRREWADLGKEAEEVARLVRLCTWWQDRRKVYTLLQAAWRHPIVEEIARRLAVAPRRLLFSHHASLIAALQKEDLSLLEDLDGCMAIYTTGGIEIEKDGGHAFAQLQRANPTEGLSGIGASPGLAQGPAAIVRNRRDMEKVVQGSVIVSSMTRPELMPALRKAAAIITDEGGITCHAAIVARELGIPCVIGTRHATRTLHDGEQVEVDADRGIVRRIDHV